MRSKFQTLQVPVICLAISGAVTFLQAATAEEPREIVKAGLPFGKVDEEMLASAENMSENELRELMELYVKKRDQVMAIRIANLLLTKNDQDEDAKALLARAGVPMADESSPAAPETPLIASARKLAADGKFKEAAAVYEQARAAQDPKVPFPFLSELASVYDDAGLLSEAMAAYELVKQNAATPAEEREEAIRRVTELNEAGQLAAVEEALDQGRIGDARKFLGTLSAIAQNSPEVRLLGAKIKLLGGEVALGEAELKQLSEDLTLTEELRAEAKEVLAEANINRLMKTGEGAFEKGNHKLAMSLSEELYGLAPQRTDVVQFRARTLLQNKQPDAALQILEKSPVGKGADSESEYSRLLAAVLENTNGYGRALDVYRDLATKPKLSLLERADLLDDADTLAGIASPRSSGDWRFMDADEGCWNAVHVNLQSGILSHALQFVGEGFWDAIAPREGSRFSGKTEADLLEVVGGMRAYLSKQLYLQGGLIGHQDGVGFGVSAGKLPLDGLGFQVRYDHQQRAAYSQALRSLNGRQNRVAGSIQTTFSSGLSLDATLGWRNVFVDQESIGNGPMGEIALMKTLIKETDTKPGVTLAYMGEWSRCSQNNTVEVRRAIGLDPNNTTNRLADLIDPRVNRHEAQVSVIRHWTPRFQSMFTGALGYEFEDQQSVWLVGLQLAYRLRPNLRITLQGDYDSSGQGINAFNAMKSVWLSVTMDY